MSETTTPTLEQHAADLERWLQERGLAPVIMARGRRTGALTAIADFMPDTHDAVFILQPRGPAQP